MHTVNKGNIWLYTDSSVVKGNIWLYTDNSVVRGNIWLYTDNNVVRGFEVVTISEYFLEIISSIQMIFSAENVTY